MRMGIAPKRRFVSHIRHRPVNVSAFMRAAETSSTRNAETAPGTATRWLSRDEVRRSGFQQSRMFSVGPQQLCSSNARHWPRSTAHRVLRHRVHRGPQVASGSGRGRVPEGRTTPRSKTAPPQEALSRREIESRTADSSPTERKSYVDGRFPVPPGHHSNGTPQVRMTGPIGGSTP